MVWWEKDAETVSYQEFSEQRVPMLDEDSIKMKSEAKQVYFTFQISDTGISENIISCLVSGILQ